MATNETYEAYGVQGAVDANGNLVIHYPITKADLVAYDNRTSGLTARDSQAAIDELSAALDAAKPLSGDSDPTSSTKGAVGQHYTNTTTGEEFTCIAADDEAGVYTWEVSGGGGGGTLTLDAIHIKTAPTKTAYKAGEVFDPTGMVVTADYSIGDVKIVEGKEVTGYTYPTSGLAAGTTKVTISLTEGKVTKTVDVTITVTKTAVTVPTFTQTLTYNTNTQTPTFNNEDSSLMTKTGDTTGLNAGSYTAHFTLNDTDLYEWASSSFNGDVAWSIGQADPNLAVSPTSVTLNSSNLTASVAITTNSDGELSASTSASGVATAAINGKTATISNVNETSGTATITISQKATTNYKAATKQIAVTASFITIVGVCKDWSNSSTALSRLTPANDPNGLVNTAISSEPVPAVGTGAGSSPCDTLEPWASMYECNHSGSAVTYKKGQSGFSRTGADTVIWIPEFYIKVINDTANNKTYYYLASGAVSGFTKMAGSGKFIARYKTGSGYVSKSGQAPLVNITRSAARSGSKKSGKWRMNDYATWCAYTYLYLVEFADFNSQAKLGKGYTDGNSAAINTGGTDSMTYHTGRAAGTDGKTSVQYRGIEDPFGNVYEWVDGINFSELKAYVCTDPTKYADDTSTGYTDTGVTLCSSAWIKKLTPSSNVAWAYFLPTEGGGSETTYVPDYVNSNTGWRVLNVGGLWDGGTGAGLFCFRANGTSSGSSSNVGARLLVDP